MEAGGKRRERPVCFRGSGDDDVRKFSLVSDLLSFSQIVFVVDVKGIQFKDKWARCLCLSAGLPQRFPPAASANLPGSYSPLCLSSSTTLPDSFYARWAKASEVSAL